MADILAAFEELERDDKKQKQKDAKSSGKKQQKSKLASSHVS